ncbi:MAG: recombinase RecA [Deltaproteobacteria bacterium]|jgi:recombination protein RecA|nr:recombinase RecA [Deltaproteobacteria bacterium]
MGFKEKLGGVRAAMAEIEKQFGRGAIMLLGEGAHLDEPLGVIPSGSVGVDRALGIGGLPQGRIIEMYGPESSGKTTMALHAIASVQRRGGVAAFVDAEHALDPRYAQALGINLEQLLVSQPDHGEQALEIVETLIRSGAVDLIVVDSVAALVPKAEVEGEMGDSHMGLQARLMSQALRKVTGHASKSKSTIIFINQIRQKIGVVFGNPETTTGGNALKFYCSVRLDIRRIGQVKEGEEMVGNRVKVKVVKNKVAPPFREAEFDILYGKGVSVAGEILDFGVEEGLFDRNGAWYSLNGERVAQGREKARDWLEQRPGLMEKLHQILVSGQGTVADLGPSSSWEVVPNTAVPNAQAKEEAPKPKKEREREKAAA